jgi:hypothetical protein
MELTDSDQELLGKKEVLPTLPVIRGHHLKILGGLYYSAMLQGIDLPAIGFPDSVPEQVVHLIKEEVERSGSKGLMEQNSKIRDRADREYNEVAVRDRIGSSPDRAEQYDQGYYKALLALISMPGNKQVLISPTPDLICDSCAIGDHCLQRELGRENEDDEIVNSLEKQMAELGFEVSPGRSRFKFSGPNGYQEVKTIIVNVEDIRQYLKAAGKVLQQDRISAKDYIFYIGSILEGRMSSIQKESLVRNLPAGSI